MNRSANLSLLFAAIPPALVVCLIFRFSFPIPTQIIVGLTLLCPLAAAFFGHDALRKRKNTPDERVALAKARAGALSGYLEILTLFLVITTIPIHRGNPKAANESSAVGSLRSLNAAAEHYLKTHSEQGYPRDLKTLCSEEGNLNGGLVVDPILATGNKSGYRFTFVPEGQDANGLVHHYQLYADPVVQDKTGMRHFYTDETGEVRYSLSEPANSQSPSIGY